MADTPPSPVNRELPGTSEKLIVISTLLSTTLRPDISKAMRLLADLHQEIGPRQTILGLKDRACALVNEVAYKASPPGTQAWARMHPRPSLYRFIAHPRRPPARSAASGARGNGHGPEPCAPLPTRRSPTWRSPTASTQLVATAAP